MQCLAVGGKLLARGQPRLAAQLSFRAYVVVPRVSAAGLSDLAKVRGAALCRPAPDTALPRHPVTHNFVRCRAGCPQQQVGGVIVHACVGQLLVAEEGLFHA